MNPRSSSALLWNSVVPDARRFAPSDRHPPLLRRLIAVGTPLATAARLRMDGEIRLKTWRPFAAEEVLHRDRGFVWRADVRPCISGFDASIDGVGSAQWRLLHLLTVARGSGSDVSRSSIGRWLAEAIWLPTMLLPEFGAHWDGEDVTLQRFSLASTLRFTLAADGAAARLTMTRWGDPGDGAFADHPFGAELRAERTFAGYTIPTDVTVGWFIGTDRWRDGCFFRARVTATEFI